jgi:hypothetical protein
MTVLTYNTVYFLVVYLVEPEKFRVYLLKY